MILILNNCINFDLIDIFLCRKYFIWSIFFLAQEFIDLVIYMYWGNEDKTLFLILIV